MTRLDEIRARLERATPGPWRSMHEGNQYVRGELVGASRIDGLDRPWNPHGIAPDDRHVARFRDANADFIAHSRADLEWAVAEIERLRKLVGMIDEEAEL